MNSDIFEQQSVMLLESLRCPAFIPGMEGVYGGSIASILYLPFFRQCQHFVTNYNCIILEFAVQ